MLDVYNKNVHLQHHHVRYYCNIEFFPNSNRNHFKDKGMILNKRTC